MSASAFLSSMMPTQLLEVLIARALKTPLTRLFSAPC
jgi:hypothetical protein